MPEFVDPFFGEEEPSAAEQMRDIFQEAAVTEAAAPAPRGRREADERVPWTPGTGGPLEPVRLYHRMEHEFEDKPDGKRGCALCGKPKKWAGHHGYPASFNVGGSSRNPHAWQNEKKLFAGIFKELLAASGLPKGLGSVFVEGTLCFPTKRMNLGPDQDNYRFPLSKHFADVLVAEGYLKDDNWLAYSFGNLAWTYEKGARWMELILLPAWPEPEDAQATLV